MRQVEYIHIVGYFSENLADCLGVTNQILTSFETRLAHRTDLCAEMEGAVWCAESTVPAAGSEYAWKRSDDGFHWNVQKSTLDSIRNSGAVFGQQLQVEYAGFSGTRKKPHAPQCIDCLWHIDYSPRDMYGRDRNDCMHVVTLSVDLFVDGLVTSQQEKTSARLVDDVIEIWLRNGSLYYALAQLSHCSEDLSGGCYYRACDGSSLRFAIEQELWLLAGEARRQKVRGLYPAQYLAPYQLAKLGGVEALAADVRKFRPYAEPFLKDLGEKGAIFRMAPTPIATSSKTSVGSTYRWLASHMYNRFRDAGLFL